MLLGEQCWGGCAECVVVPRANLVPVPRATVPLDDTALAAVPIAFITAWQMLVDRAVLRQGETVLVLAAGSGVGTAADPDREAVRRARDRDRVDRRAKLPRARALGADDVINYRTERDGGGGQATHRSPRRRRRRRARRRGHVSEVGGRGRTGGRIVTCGATDGFETVLNLRHVFWRQLSILGSTLASKARLFEIVSLMAAGKLRPIVDRVLPLAEIGEAHRLLESRAVFGKVVLAASV